MRKCTVVYGIDYFRVSDRHSQLTLVQRDNLANIGTMAILSMF